MNDSDDILINEISVPRTKLRDLIRAVWGHRKKSDSNVLKAKQSNFPKSSTGSKSRSKKSKRMTGRQLSFRFPKEKEIDYSTLKPESEPQIEKPKVISTLFSKKLDTSKPPFYTDADKWYEDNFKREDSQGYTYSVRYVGPTLDDYKFVFSSYPHDNDVKSFNKYYDEREQNMEIWNLLLKDYVKKKWPNEFAGMNEQFKLQK